MKQNKISILNIPFTTLYQGEILDLITAILAKPARQFFLATPNPEMLLEAKKNKEFLKILQNTDLNIPDGNGIIWANIYQNFTEKNRSSLALYLKGLISYTAFLFHRKNENKIFNRAIHGSDLMLAICQDSNLSKHKIFLLGNKHGLKQNISALTTEALKKTNPDINITGHYDGDKDDQFNLEKIKKASPEILFVAFGSPNQEIWLSENLAKLTSVKIAIGVGGTFDFISGVIPRAPSIMRKTGLEWMYRLYKQPRRIKRIINAAVVFPLKVIAERSKRSNSPDHQ